MTCYKMQESDQFCRTSYGAFAKTGTSPDPRVGDDAAADAGHQAAATLQPRPRRLCGERTRANPLLERANDDETPATAGESNSQPPGTGEDGAGNADWMGTDLETSRSSMEQGLGTELENVFPDDGGEKPAK